MLGMSLPPQEHTVTELADHTGPLGRATCPGVQPNSPPDVAVKLFLDEPGI